MLRTLALLFLLALLSGAAQALESVTLQLKWRHQFQFAGYYAALEKGYYREAGLDVKLVEASPATQVVMEVVSGRAQYGVGTSALLLARRQAPVVALAVIFQHSPLILLAREDRAGNLHQLADQEVMIEADSEELLAYLRQEGLPPEKLRILPHSQSIGDLIDGRVAAMSAYSTTEAYLLRRAGLPAIEFSPRAAGIDFYGDNLFTSQQELKQHPERVRAFRAASLRGWDYAMKHPDEMIELILARYNSQGLDREFLAYEASRTAQLMQAQLIEIGHMNRGRWQHIADTYAELDMQVRGELPADFLYTHAAPRPLPAWLLPTAVVAGLAMLGLGWLALRNIQLGRQLRREIAAQQEAHRQLARSEDHYRFMLDNSADAFWELDPQYRFTYISPADKRIRGFEASEVLGQSLLSMLTPESARSLQQQLAQRRADQPGAPDAPLRFEFEIVCKNGSTVWAEAQSVPFRDEAGCILGFHGVTRDISEHKRHRTELQEANQLLARQLDEIGELQARLQEQAIRDALTGLYNRRYLDETLARELARARRDGYPLSLIMIDIDHFKQINDSYGHPAGDDVIRALAALLRQSCRDGDIACRYGGEEFIVAMPQMDARAAHARAEALCDEAAARPVRHGEQEISYTISAGVCAYPIHSTDAETLIACADLALYRSKTAGRNRVTGFDVPEGKAS